MYVVFGQVADKSYAVAFLLAYFFQMRWFISVTWKLFLKYTWSETFLGPTALLSVGRGTWALVV